MPDQSGRAANNQSTLGREEIAGQISLVGVLMLVIFLITVLGVVVPPRILDPAWQLRVISTLVGNGTIPLVGFLLLPLAASIDPANRRLEARWHQFRTWALLPVIGYALLIPLQAVAIARGLQNAYLQQNRQLTIGTSRIAEVRNAVQESSTTAQLAERLKALRAPMLSPAALNQPMPTLRRELLASLSNAENQLRQNNKGLPIASIWGVVQNGIRETLTSLLYGLAFACVAYRPATPVSLLQEWKLAWLNRGRRARARAMERQESESPSRQGRSARKGLGLPQLGRRSEDRDYLRRLSRKDDD